MGTRYLSDDECLLDLVRLIATRHPSTLTTIQDLLEESPYLARSTISFMYRETGVRNEHECSCHYDNEYMTYITASGFDFEKFSQVARNVARGFCRHAKDGSSNSSLGLCSADSEVSLQSLAIDCENNILQNRKIPRAPSVSLSFETDDIVDNFHTKLRPRMSDSSMTSVESEADLCTHTRARFSIGSDSPCDSPVFENEEAANMFMKTPPYSRQSSTGSSQVRFREPEDTAKKGRMYKRRSIGNYSPGDLDVRGHPRLSRRRSSALLRLLDMEIEDIKMKTETSLIHVAAAVGDASLLSYLLKKAGACLEQLGAFQLSPLHLAILKKKVCYLKHIILQPETYLANKSGVFKFASRPIDRHGHKGRLSTTNLSLIGLCVKMNDTDTLVELLDAGVLRDAALLKGLKEAVESDSSECVDIMLKTGVRPNLDIMKEGTSKSMGVFECLFRRFRKDFKVYSLQHPETVIRDLLMPSILTKNIEVVRILVQNGIPVNHVKGFYSPVTCAVLDNQPEILKLLLENNADKSAEIKGYTLLDIANCMGFKECTGEYHSCTNSTLPNTETEKDILKKHNAKKTRNIKSIVPANLLMGIAGKLNSTWDQTKLHRQIEHKQHGFDGDTVLHVAIRCKLSLPLMREILSTGSDVNAKNKKSQTPLMLAISKDVGAAHAVIRELLYFNPILEQTDKASKTTLDLAIARDFMERNLISKNGSMSGPGQTIASLLLDCGYSMRYEDNKKSSTNSVYALKGVWNDLAVTIGCGRDIRLQAKPVPLKVRCRETLRRAYTGIRLHKFLKFMKVPPEVKDFVLFTELLRIETDEY